MTTLLDSLGRPMKHGKSKTAEYRIWIQMRSRCRNPNCPRFGRYGGRGISVCPEWDDFLIFLKDMGPRPSPGHAIERIDNNGNYEPDNCIWGTRHQQNSNKVTSVRLSLNGRSFTVSEWASLLRVNTRSLFLRIEHGWSAEEALTTPFAKRRFRKQAGHKNNDGVPPESGFVAPLGVSWNRKRRYWTARVKHDGSRIFLGCFNTWQEARGVIEVFRREEMLPARARTTTLPPGADTRKRGA